MHARELFPKSWRWHAGLAECVLRRSIEKDQTLRTGNWEAWPLSAEQQQYAALDAYASLLIYKVSKVQFLAISAAT